MEKKIIALVSDDFEDLELWYPALRLREAGYQVDFTAERKGAVYHGKSWRSPGISTLRP